MEADVLQQGFGSNRAQTAQQATTHFWTGRARTMEGNMSEQQSPLSGRITRRFLVQLLLLTGGVAQGLSAACVPQAPQAAAPTLPAAPTAPKPTSGGATTTSATSAPTGGSQAKTTALRLAMGTDASKLDPNASLASTEAAITLSVFDNLTTFDDDLKLQPLAATSWKLVDDRTWQFKIRQGINFHNGDPLTATDVKFSVERARKDGSYVNRLSLN